MGEEKGLSKEGIILIIIGVIVLVLLIAGFTIGWDKFLPGLYGGESATTKLSCIELYPLDSCELYKCRAENSNWIPDTKFNLRNYEFCKIIINKNMSFNESLDLLGVLTYDS